MIPGDDAGDQSRKRARIVNGEHRSLEVPEGWSLLHALRDILDLRAVRFGCGLELCGACTVLLDDRPIRSCTFAFDDSEDKRILTPEGLLKDKVGRIVVESFIARQAGQCGYCLAGIAMTVTALLKRVSDPDRDQIIAALDPHLCRCGTHTRIIDAVELAASRLA